MGYATCGLHKRRVCWRCDRCPTCDPDTGRLLRGDYCRRCTEALKAQGYVWSDYCKDYVEADVASKFRGTNLQRDWIAEHGTEPFALVQETTSDGAALARAAEQRDCEQENERKRQYDLL